MLLDPEIAYIQMREANPGYVEALMAPDAMTIPANTETGVETREARTGPVFSIDAASGDLHMRYTARTRSIEWKQDETTVGAVAFLEEMLKSSSPYVFQNRLSAGQGLVCNNVLHNRTAFDGSETGESQRLVYRARYYERITNRVLENFIYFFSSWICAQPHFPQYLRFLYLARKIPGPHLGQGSFFLEILLSFIS